MQLDIFDITDISRGRGNAVSAMAHEKLKPHKKNQRQIVLGNVDGFRCTMEIAELMGVPLHKISGRFTELKAAGKIVVIGKKEYNGGHYTIYKEIK